MYVIQATNNAGASTRAGTDYDHPSGGAKYSSIKAACVAARREMGSGWHIIIRQHDTGDIVREFTIR